MEPNIIQIQIGLSIVQIKFNSVQIFKSKWKIQNKILEILETILLLLFFPPQTMPNLKSAHHFETH